MSQRKFSNGSQIVGVEAADFSSWIYIHSLGD